MKIINSLIGEEAAQGLPHRSVARAGSHVINKTNPRYKARQG